jgi:LysM repeat protein
MAARSPARFLAPLALLAVVVALYMIVGRTSPDAGSSGSGTSTGTQQPAAKRTAHGGAKASRKKHARFHTVKPGETPSGIAQAAGISLTRLEALNPNLDPQSLTPGERLKLR